MWRVLARIARLQSPFLAPPESAACSSPSNVDAEPRRSAIVLNGTVVPVAFATLLAVEARLRRSRETPPQRLVPNSQSQRGMTMNRFPAKLALAMVVGGVVAAPILGAWPLLGTLAATATALYIYAKSE